MIKTSVNNCREQFNARHGEQQTDSPKHVGKTLTLGSLIISIESKTHPGIGQRDSAPI